MVLKAQQEPHCSWFFTGVTAPFDTQSTLLGAVALAYLKGLPCSLSLHSHSAESRAARSRTQPLPSPSLAGQAPELAARGRLQSQPRGPELLGAEVCELVDAHRPAVPSSVVGLDGLDILLEGLHLAGIHLHGS